MKNTFSDFPLLRKNNNLVPFLPFSGGESLPLGSAYIVELTAADLTGGRKLRFLPQAAFKCGQQPLQEGPDLVLAPFLSCPDEWSAFALGPLPRSYANSACDLLPYPVTPFPWGLPDLTPKTFCWQYSLKSLFLFLLFSIQLLLSSSTF